MCNASDSADVAAVLRWAAVEMTQRAERMRLAGFREHADEVERKATVADRVSHALRPQVASR